MENLNKKQSVIKAQNAQTELPKVSSSDLLGLRGEQNKLSEPDISAMCSFYDFWGNPTMDYAAWLSKTNSPPSLESEACFVVYYCEIGNSLYQRSLPWSLIESHCHRLGLSLRNHATSYLAQAVRKVLENSPYQSLLEVSSASLDTDIDRLSRKTSLNIFRQYGLERKVRIPSCPTADFEMEIHWGSAVPLISEPIRGSFGNRSIPEVADVLLECLGASYMDNNNKGK